MDKGTILGMKVERIIKKPATAAIIYSMDMDKTGRESSILVFNLSGSSPSTMVYLRSL